MTITATGVRRLREIVAQHPNVFDSVARDTLDSLLDMGAAFVAGPPCVHFDGRHGRRVCGECGEDVGGADDVRISYDDGGTHIRHAGMLPVHGLCGIARPEAAIVARGHEAEATCQECRAAWEAFAPAPSTLRTAFGLETRPGGAVILRCIAHGCRASRAETGVYCEEHGRRASDIQGREL